MKKIFSILLVALFAMGLVSCGGSKPESVVDEYEQAIVKQDYKKALSLTTLSEEEQQGYLEMIASLSALTREEDQLQDFAILEVNEVSETEAVVVVEETTKGGKTKTDEIQLVKVDGAWKVVAGK